MHVRIEVVFFLLIKPIVLLNFLLSSVSLDLKVTKGLFT